MDEPTARRLPWGLVLTIVLLTLLLGTVFQAAPWRVVLAVLGIAVGTFLTLRRLQNYLWGVLGALLLALHPLSWEWSPPFEMALSAEALELLVLATVLFAWHLVGRTTFAGSAWLMVTVALCLSGGLAWLARPQAGLVTVVLTAVGLPLGTLLVALRHRTRPAWGNPAVAVVLGLATPVLGLLLASATGHLLDWPASTGPARGAFDFLAALVETDAAGWEVRGYAVEHIHRWTWPAAWAVLPLLLLGLWLTLRRGRKLLAARRTPLPWVLTLYALAELLGVVLHPRTALATVALPLASVALLLALFALAEVVHEVFRPLVLPPPEERMAEET